MFGSKKANLVIAIILAIGLWIYVVGVVDPSTNGKVTDVNVTFTNEETLKDEGLQIAEVTDPNETQVTVTIKGARSDVKQVKAEDILITANVGDLKEGKNEVALSISVPSTVDYVRADKDKIEVTVEKIDK